MPERIVVVGVPGAVPPEQADLWVGGRRHLDRWAPRGARTCNLGDIADALRAVAAEPGVVCVLASCDPGFFGVLRPIRQRFPDVPLEVRPAPSSVSLAFARLGLPWDDAVIVSAHGRPLEDAAAVAAGARKAAVLVAPDALPEALGKELLARGARHTDVAVCSRLGLDDEEVVRTDLAGLAAGTWDCLSVVVLLDESPIASSPSLAWGWPDDAFEHRAGMVTKAEVRAVVLGKLDLPERGVLWDVGAGSGSVSVECARLRPELRVIAVERRADDADRVRANAVLFGAPVEVVHGEAPDALAGLPDPDRAFVGGGGIDVLDAVLARVRPGGAVVATYAALDRAAAAAERLPSLVQVGLARGERLPDGGLRLASENPVFVVWGTG